MIQNNGNVVYVIVISLWEITIKTTIGKLDIKLPLDKFFALDVDENGFETLPLTREHLLTVRDLSLHYRDPFDRILVAQSLSEGMPFISGDAKLDAYGINRL